MALRLVYGARMKTALLVTLAALALSTAACSKNKCDLKTDGDKQGFGALADMTAGAFSCDVEGKADIAGHVDDSLKCEIGAANCLGVMNAIHAAPATVKDVSANYKAYLEKGGWKVEEKEVKSKFANGKAITGSHLAATNAGKSITVKVFPFGTDMVETRTYLAAMQ